MIEKAWFAMTLKMDQRSAPMVFLSQAGVAKQLGDRDQMQLTPGGKSAEC